MKNAFLSPLLACLILSLAPAALHGAYGDLLWTAMTGDTLYGAPAIAADGSVIVGSQDGNVYAFNSDGSEKWIYSGAADWIDSAPTIGPDGSVYFGSWDGFLYAVDGQTGSLKWKYETGAFIIASPAVGPDGTVYVGSNDTFLYALNADGSLKWFSDSIGSYSPINSSPVLNSSGDTVYFGNDSGEVFALNTVTGSQRWSFSISDIHPPDTNTDVAISGSIAVAEDGRLFFGSENGYLYVLAADGTLDWSYQAAESIRCTPAISSDGTVTFAAQDGYLYALDSEGWQLWETFIGDVFYCSPALDAAGNILIAGYAGSTDLGAATRFASIDSGGVIQWEFLIADYNDSSPNIAPDGSIYFGAHDGMLYKFEGADPLMDGQWPRFQGNSGQTGIRHNARDPGEESLWDYFSEITQATVDGWAYIPWFGSGWIYNSGLPWVRHIDHGYLFLSSSSGNGIWFYDLKLKDWLYATADAPDYYYRYGTDSWMLHARGTPVESGRWFYDFLTGTWFQETD